MERRSFRARAAGVACVSSLVLFVATGAAHASPGSVFKGAVKCTTQPDGIRFRGSLAVHGQATPVRTFATTWDGTAFDVNFALPRRRLGTMAPTRW